MKTENLLLGFSALSLAWMGFADKSLMRGGNFNTLKLGDIAIVQVNLPNADFWLQRRGSEKTVGTVLRTFTNAEDIGIKIKPEYLSVIDPTYLSYLFEHFFNQLFRYCHPSQHTQCSIPVSINLKKLPQMPASRFLKHI